MNKVQRVLDELRSRRGFDILDDLDEEVLEEIEVALAEIIYDENEPT